jgi:GntR family transcriptional regulator
MDLDRDAPEPLYEQLASVLRDQIATGVIPARRALPPRDVLAERAGVSVRTVNKALDVLRAEGLVVTVAGKGIYTTGR